jgi:hypothetical protein
LSAPDDRPRRYALTRDDQILADVLAAAPWHLYRLRAAGEWSARCERIAERLAVFGVCSQ